MATEYYQLQIQGTAGTLETMTSHVFKSDGVTANDTLDNGIDLIEAWKANLKDLWLTFNSDHYQVKRLIARRLSPHGSAVAHFQYQAGDATGVSATEIGGVNLAPAVRLIPSTLGSTAGRCFLPAPPKDQINANAYAAAYVTDVAAYFNAAIAGITETFTWVLAVHHKKAQTFSVCAGFNLSPRFGFQGRRRHPIS